MNNFTSNSITISTKSLDTQQLVNSISKITLVNKIKQIICNNIIYSLEVKEIDTKDIMTNLGIDSMIFIKIVVDIENEFEFEFDVEQLNADAFHTVNDLIDYVKTNINK